MGFLLWLWKAKKDCGSEIVGEYHGKSPGRERWNLIWTFGHQFLSSTVNICLKYILSRPGETCRSSNALLRIFSVADFCTREKSLGNAGDPFGRNRFPGCGTTVGGADDPNHSATSQFLVFSLEKSPFHEIFCFPLSRGFYPQNCVQKTGLCVSRTGEVNLSRTGEILGRETPVWAAQVEASYCLSIALMLAKCSKSASPASPC